MEFIELKSLDERVFMRFIKKLFLTYSFAIALFFCIRMVVLGSSYASLAMLLGLDFMQNATLLNSWLLVFTGLCATNFYQVLSNRISIYLLRLNGLVYVVVLLGITLLKSQGVQEVNLDMFDFYRQIIEYPCSVFLNVLLFVPLGVGLAFRVKSLTKASCGALFLILILEIIQYSFSLGIADIVDVFINFMGFFVGYALVEGSRNKGLRFICREPNYFCFEFLPNECFQDDLGTQSNTGFFHMVCGVLTACVIAFLAGFLVYDYEPYVAPNPYEITTNDMTLCELPLGLYGAEEVNTFIENMSLACLGGSKSTSDWINADADGLLCVIGGVASCQGWLTESGEQGYGIVVGVNERIDGVVLTNGIPLVITEYTSVYYSDKKVEFKDMGTFFDTLPQSEIEAEFFIEDGWFNAVELSLSPSSTFENYYTGFDFLNITSLSEETNIPADGYWIDVPLDELITLEGYVDVLHDDPNIGSYLTVRICDKIGSAAVSQCVEVWFEDGVPDNFEEELFETTGLVSLKVSLRDSKLYFQGIENE